jgi:hypothetical protein
VSQQNYNEIQPQVQHLQFILKCKWTKCNKNYINDTLIEKLNNSIEKFFNLSYILQFQLTENSVYIDSTTLTINN